MRWIILVFATLLLFFSCKKIERINPVDGIVGVQTSDVRQLDLSSVQIGSTLQITEEVPYVTQRGVCWSMKPNPTTANDFVAQGNGFGTFQSKITGLAANTTYYFRSFASNEKTTAYGNEVSYTIKAPVLRTKTAIDVSYTSAKVGGELVNDGGLIVSEYGIYWGVFPGITSENSKLTANQKDFYLDLTELENGKTYYYRTFAQTNSGIVYGEELSFNTLGYNTPSLTTKLVTSIGTNSAVSGGEITSDGGLAITEKGVCWSTITNSTIADNKSMEGAGTDSFTSKLDGLEDGVTYYVRAYATNSKGTSYGNEVSFTTFAFYKPTLTTNSISSIYVSGAVSGGVISSDGGASITAKGICWTTTSNPTIISNKTNDGSGSLSFTSQLSGLQEGTKYYVRAYATNAKGTSYGNEVSFTTTAINKPTLTTNTITNISSSSATSGGVISSDGGVSIIAKGICWSATSNPTITSNKTNDGSGSLSFTSQLSGLQEGTTYYVRAYATNAKGTSYGNEVSFTTTAINKPTLTTNTITNISSTSATSGGVISSDGGALIIAKGICWSTSSNPTVANNITNEGTGVTSFTCKMTGLQEGTKYYVRAYATNAKGTSYGQEVSFAANEMIIDIEGNKYKTVKIGTQTWMAENLKTSKYSDGTAITNVTDNTNWSNLTTGAWSYYSNDAANNAKYGKLYNWYAVSPTTNGNKNVCPSGWYVPTDAEWTVLTDYLGGASVAGGKMKEVGTTNWYGPNIDATNMSLFTGLPGGKRNDDGSYGGIGYSGYWWSSTYAWYRTVGFINGTVDRLLLNTRSGFSVRCLRN